MILTLAHDNGEVIQVESICDDIDCKDPMCSKTHADERGKVVLITISLPLWHFKDPNLEGP